MRLPFNAPSELLLEIFELAGAEPWGTFCADYHTLRSCALVCKAWTPYAQHVLFRNAVFDTCDDGEPSRFTSFYDTIRDMTIRGSQLPLVVRSLSVDVGSAKVGTTGINGVLIQHANLHVVAVAISLLPNLRHLQLFVINEMVQFVRFDEEDLPLMRSARYVTHVSVIGAVEDDVLLSQALFVWPDITHLTVEFGGAPITNVQMQCPKLDTLFTLDEPPVEFFQYLSCTSKPLSNLRMHIVSDLETYIRPFVTTIRDLFLGFPDVDESPKGSWPCPDVLSACTQLERFGVGVAPTRYLLDALPPTVWQLNISPHLCSPEQLQVIMDYLASNPRIRSVQINLFRNAMNVYQQSMRLVHPLVCFCQQRGIHVEEKENEYCLFPNNFLSDNEYSE